MADPKKLATTVLVDVDGVEITIDGEVFPYAVAEVGLTLVEVGRDLVPAVELKLVAGTLEVVSARSGGL